MIEIGVTVLLTTINVLVNMNRYLIDMIPRKSRNNIHKDESIDTLDSINIENTQLDSQNCKIGGTNLHIKVTVNAITYC